jgi:hypothetical protein
MFDPVASKSQSTPASRHVIGTPSPFPEPPTALITVGPYLQTKFAASSLLPVPE